MDNKNNLVLVTGGAGLVGNELIAQLLAKGKKIRAIYHRTPLQDFSQAHVEQMQCDILDVTGLEEAFTDVDEVYHCAAIVTFDSKRKKELYKINIEGTANVVNAALDAKVSKMVHVSSVAALGRIRENEMINETMTWTPETSNSAYGQSKFLGEMEVWRGIGEGLNAVIVNPVVILGAGDWNNGSSQIFKSIYDGFPWYSEGTTGFVDVKDVAKAMIILMESDINAEKFILSAEDKSYHEVFDLIADGFAKPRPTKKITPLLASIKWRLEKIKQAFTGISPLVTKETASTALAKATFDNSKLLKALPAFSYRALSETIKEVCEDFSNKS